MAESQRLPGVMSKKYLDEYLRENLDEIWESFLEKYENDSRKYTDSILESIYREITSWIQSVIFQDVEWSTNWTKKIFGLHLAYCESKRREDVLDN